MSEKKNSASISGSGTIAGGTYERVSISGSGKVTGEVTADEVRISGAGKIEGRTHANRITTSGSASFDADVVAEDEMKVSGSAKVTGDVKAKELKCSGAFRVDGSVSADYVKSSGSLRVGSDLEAEIFRATGGFRIGGLLSADHIEIRLAGHCEATEIGGERIEVHRGGWKERSLIMEGLIRVFSGGGAAELRAQQIEGDDIHLEGTTARVVRGKRISIGPDCDIERVEYTDTLEVHPDASVHEHTKR